MRSTEELSTNPPSLPPEEAVQYVTFSPHSYLETDVLKDTNNNVGKGRLSPKSPRLRRIISSMTSPKSIPKVKRTSSAKMSREHGSQFSKTPKHHLTAFTNDGFRDSPTISPPPNYSKYNTLPARYDQNEEENEIPQVNKHMNSSDPPIGFHTAPRQHILNDDLETATLPHGYKQTQLLKDREFKDSELKPGHVQPKPHISFNTPEYDGFHMNDKQTSYTLPRDYESNFHRTSYHPPSERHSNKPFQTHHRGTLTKREIKDLNALLGEFGEDKLESPGTNTDDELLNHHTSHILAKKVKVKLTNTNLTNRKDLSNQDAIKNQSSLTTSSDHNKLSQDFENILNDLLSVGTNETLLQENHTLKNTDTNTVKENHTIDGKDIDSHFDSITEALRLAVESSENDDSNDESANFEDDLNGNLDENLDENLNSEHIEGTDSGIDETVEETMPGLMRDTTSQSHNSKQHKSKDKKSKGKHSGDKKHERKHRSKDEEGGKRSESEPRRTKKHHGETSRSNSAPRHDGHRSRKHKEENGDHDERSGRSKERRSEPHSNGHDKHKSDKRRSEPVVTNKIRHENDIDGGAVGEYKRRNTDGSSNKKPKDKRHSSRSPHRKHGPKVVIPEVKHIQNTKNEISLIPDKNARMKQNDSPLAVNTSKKEYMWDTADGKHRVYMRQNKNDDPGPLPKKQAPPEYDTTKHSPRYHPSRAEIDLANDIGVTPDMIRLLQEEEKFWQKQQELKRWRETQDNRSHQSDHENHKKERFNAPSYEIHESRDTRHRDSYPPPERHYSNASKHIHFSDSKEQEREADEQRMAMKAERLMKIRAQQEHVLKASRENLLRDEPDAKTTTIRRSHEPPPYHNTQNKPTKTRQSYPPEYQNTRGHETRNSKRNVNNVNTIERNYKTDKIAVQDDVAPFSLTDRTNSWGSKPDSRHSESVSSPGYMSSLSPTSPRSHNLSDSNSRNNSSAFSPTNSSRSYSFGSKPPLPNTRTNTAGGNRPYNCFSDDDEVFNEKRREKESPRNDDHRGYFSDYEPVQNTMDKTFLARPLIRPKRSQLRCTSCCKVISDERLMHVEGQNYYWHLKCFLCTVCRAYLNDKHAIRVRIVNYDLHCRFCYSHQDGDQLCSEV